MNKIIILSTPNEAREQEKTLVESASKTHRRIQKLANSNPLDFLEKLKFERVGCDPLDSENEWNLVEQLNQTFTYLASFRAAVLLFEWHPNIKSLTLNLGTASGTDIESSDCGGIAAEVFAATNPNNNQKLNKDIKKVQKVKASHKYVFFMCPNIEAGKYQNARIRMPEEVKVWSLALKNTNPQGWNLDVIG